LQRFSLSLPVGMRVLTIFEKVPELAWQLIVILLSTSKHILVILHVILVQNVLILLPAVVIIVMSYLHWLWRHEVAQELWLNFKHYHLLLRYPPVSQPTQLPADFPRVSSLSTTSMSLVGAGLFVAMSLLWNWKKK
jgi:drug/metabolite transporter superfamily protein YnfA